MVQYESLHQFERLTAVAAHANIDGGISSSSGASLMHEWNALAFFWMMAVLGVSVKNIVLMICAKPGC